MVGELRERLPRILRGHTLENMWAYKYDGSLGGINVHADNAAVNLNYWLTPDSANLDPDGGGLIVYRTRAPEAATAMEAATVGGWLGARGDGAGDDGGEWWCAGDALALACVELFKLVNLRRVSNVRDVCAS